MRPLAALITVTAFALAACDNGDSTSSRTATPAATAPPAVDFATPGPTTFRVIAGKGIDTIDVERFMPADVHVRAGDSIEWTSSGYEGHTVTFADGVDLATFDEYLVPDPEDPQQRMFNPELALRSEVQDVYPGAGTLVNSGFIGVPAEQTYTLRFETEGLYQYLCLVHPLTMRGTVSVDSAEAQVEAPESVAARGDAQLEQYVEETKRALDASGDEDRASPAPGGATLHRVAVGVTSPYGQATNFVSPDLEITAGDTVIFENDDRNFHNVIFKGDRDEFPPAYAIRVDPAGRGFNVALDKQSATAVDPPAEGFDDTTFLSSGTMGITQPRLTWRLRFDNPGTYIYQCTIHFLSGMAGVIEVRPP